VRSSGRGGSRVPRRKSLIEPKAAPAHPVTDLAEARSAVADIGLAAGMDNAPTGRSHDPRQEKVTAWSPEFASEAFQALALAVTAELDVRRLVKPVLEAAMRTLGAARGILFLGKEEAELVPFVALNVRGEELEKLEKMSRTVLAHGRAGAVVVIHDARTDPRYRDTASIQSNDMRSILCAPLIGRAGYCGLIYLDSPGAHAFPPESDQMLRSFAEVAARALENARTHSETLRDNARLRRRQTPGEAAGQLVGSGPILQTLRSRIRTFGLLDSPVLIRGERGTGRELAARAIHDESARAAQPFVAFDCSTVPQDLLKGFLLGRTGVAALGQYLEETGLLQSADRSTLYLGEAEHLGVQPGDQLAKILTTRMYRPMGGRRDVRMDVRLIFGTGTDLEGEVRGGRFPHDLYSMAQGLSLWMPPLRERLGDLPELVSHFLQVHGKDNPSGPGTSFLGPEAFQVLAEQPWPGNIEELELVVRRLLLFGGGGVIDANQVRRALLPPTEEQAKRQGPWSGRILKLSEWEAEAVRQAMIAARGNLSRAAELLGVHRNTIVRKVQELDR
jgi:DNA-binding NtrC family response regulator